MPWPAWYQTTEPSEGTCYIRGMYLPSMVEKHRRSGQAWRYNHKWTTYCPNRRLSYKALDRLMPENEDDFWQIMDAARRAGLQPPTSFADLFLSTYHAPMPRVSVCAPFVGFRFGGWQEAFRRGQAPGRVYQYDLNKAYRWSASCGLPDLRTAYPTRDFTKPYAIYSVRGIPPGVIPYRRVPSDEVHMVTSEERDAFKLTDVRSLRILKGFAFSRSIDLSDTFRNIDTQFSRSIAARISRAFWGLWNTRTAPEQIGWKHGEKIRQMRNPWYNPIWSAFITSRVKLRLNVFRGRMLHCFVDSVHVQDELPTGDQPGDWKLVGTFDRFWCRAPGRWGDGEYTLKWCGAGSVVLSDQSPAERQALALGTEVGYHR